MSVYKKHHLNNEPENKKQSTGIFSMQVLIPSVLILFVYGLSNGLGKHIAAGTSNSVYVGND